MGIWIKHNGEMRKLLCYINAGGLSSIQLIHISSSDLTKSKDAVLLTPFALNWSILFPQSPLFSFPISEDKSSNCESSYLN